MKDNHQYRVRTQFISGYSAYSPYRYTQDYAIVRAKELLDRYPLLKFEVVDLDGSVVWSSH